MLVADRFKQIFGVYATEIWALPESDFLNWLNSEAPELKIGIREMTICKNCKHAEWDYVGFCNTGYTVPFVDGCKKDMGQPSGRDCDGYEEDDYGKER